MNNYDAWKLDSPDCSDELTDADIRSFYDHNQEFCEEKFAEHVIENDWGSGEDKITITDDMFWEFVEQLAFDDFEAYLGEVSWRA